MVDETKALQSQLEEAAAKADWKAVIELGSQLKKLKAAQEQADLEANKELIVELANKMRGEFIRLSNKFKVQIIALVGEEKARIKFE